MSRTAHFHCSGTAVPPSQKTVESIWCATRKTQDRWDKRYMMIILHSNRQLSHLHLSFGPSPQMWQEHHTVCLRCHRTSPMFSKCGALLLMSAVLQISGVTGVPRWNGAPVGEILIAQIGTWMDLLSFVFLQFFPHHVSVVCREQQTRRVAGVLCCSVSPSAVSAGFDVLFWEVRDV